MPSLFLFLPSMQRWPPSWGLPAGMANRLTVDIYEHTPFISVDYLTHKEFFSNYLDSPTRPLNIRGGTIIFLPALRPRYTFVLPELIQLKFMVQIQDLNKLEQTQIWCHLNRAAELKEELIWPNYFNVNLLLLKVTAFVIALYLS